MWKRWGLAPTLNPDPHGPPLRVLHVSAYVDPQGRPAHALLAAWPMLGEVAAAVARAGAEVAVVQAAAEDAVIHAGDGVAFHFVRERTGLGARALQWPRRLAARAASLAPDVIHLHGLSFPLAARLLARAIPRTPVLLQDHADRPPAGALRRSVYRWGFRHIGGVAFTVREQAAPYFRAGLVRSGTPVLEVLPASTHFTPGDQAAARARTGLSGEPCLLWLAGLDANKDPLTVLDAVARASEGRPGLKLWCCYGKTLLLDAVRARIAGDARLAGRVTLLGRVPHERVEDLLRAADFLVVGSHSEGSGPAVVEALACGVTPLVTDIPSFRWITGDGAAGALSPPGDAAAMAGAIVEWSGRDLPALRRSAREHFERSLSYEAVGRQHLAAYRALLDGR